MIPLVLAVLAAPACVGAALISEFGSLNPGARKFSAAVAVAIAAAMTLGALGDLAGQWKVALGWGLIVLPLSVLLLVMRHRRTAPPPPKHEEVR